VHERLRADVGEVCSGDRFDEVVARVAARELDPHSAADALLAERSR
jgi:hypothetical protein